MVTVHKFPEPTAPPSVGQASVAPPIGIPFQHQQAQYTPTPPAQSGAPGAWSTGLCDCFSDVPNCCMTCWCPCVTFGQIAEIVDKGSTSCVASGALYALIAYVTGCSCVYSCFYRSKMRSQYKLAETPCPDCIVHLCCESCALCQEYRELKHRGFDMSIGWHGNLEKQNQGVAMATPPYVQGGMMR